MSLVKLKYMRTKKERKENLIMIGSRDGIMESATNKITSSVYL